MSRLRRLVTVTAVVAVVAVVASLIAVRQQRRADDNAAEARAASALADDNAASALAASALADDNAEEARAAEALAAAEAERATASADEAVAQAERAEVALADAEVATLVSRSAALVDENPTASLLLAAEAYDREPGNRTTAALATALGARVWETSRIDLDPVDHLHCEEGHDSHSSYLRGTRDGWVGWIEDGEMSVVDPGTGETRRHTTMADRCGDVFWSYSDGPIVHDADGVAFVERVPGSGELTRLPVGPGWWGVVTSDGPSGLIAVFADGPSGDVEIHLIGSDDELIASPLEIGIDPIGFVLSASGGYGLAWEASFNELQGHEVQLVDAATGDGLWRADLPAQISGVEFSPSDSLVAVSDRGGSVNVYDRTTGSLTARFGPGDGPVNSVSFLDERRLALATTDGVEVWDLTSGASREVQIPLTGADAVAALGPQAVSVITTGLEQLVILDLERSGLARRLATVPAGARVYISPEGIGAVAAVAAAEGALIDLRSGDTVTHSLTVPDAGVVVGISPGRSIDEYLAFTIDGSIGKFVGGELVDTLRLSSDADATIRNARGHRTPDGGSRVAVYLSNPAVDGSDEVYLVDLITLEVVFSVVGECPCDSVIPTPDGEALVLDNGFAVTVHTADDEPHQLTARTSDPSRAGSTALAVDQAGDRLLRGSSDGVVEVIDVRTGASAEVADFGIAVASLAFVDDTRAVVLTISGDAWLIDTQMAERIGLVWDGGGGDITSGAPTVSADGDLLWIPTSSEIVEIPLSPDAWRDLACDLAGRDLTSEEWATLVPGDAEQRPLCPPQG